LITRFKVEYPFRVIKRQFEHVKVRYRGPSKNSVQLVTLFAPSSPWMARAKLLILGGSIRSELANVA
jgi:IS5 family transposase